MNSFTIKFMLVCVLTTSCTSKGLFTEPLRSRELSINLQADNARSVEYFEPSTELQKNITIIIFHGSEGGSEKANYLEASLFATKGYRVILFCYFDCSRGRLEARQKLEYFNLAELEDFLIAHLQDKATRPKLVFFGISRGAELALTYASHPEVFKTQPDLVVLHAAPIKIFGPVNLDWYRKSCWKTKRTENDCKDPYCSKRIWNTDCGPMEPLPSDKSISPWVINGRPLKPDTRIEVEKIKVPLFLSVGEKDEIWPANFSKEIFQQRRALQLKTELVIFESEKHELSLGLRQNRVDLISNFIRNQLKTD